MARPDNKAILSAVFAETAKGNGRPFVDALADNVRWTIIGTTAWSRTYVGKRDVVGNLLMPLAAQFDGPNTIEATRILGDENHIVVEARGHNTTLSGLPYRNTYCWIIVMADGKMAELVEYADTELMRSALTAPPPAA